MQQLKKPSRKLTAEWAQKLIDSGFSDIEREDGHFVYRDSSMIDYRNKNWEAQAEYFYLASDFLNVHKFKSNLERIIWEYHANGLSVVDIAETLSKVRRNKIGRMTVWRILKKLQPLMKKHYGVIK
jgi:hypothetical protein